MKRPTALITGASSGIGKEFAKVLAAQQHDLVLVARNRERLEQIKTELTGQSGIDVHILPKDLGQVGAADEVFRSLAEKGIQIDVLINNAGFGDFGKFAETDWAKESQMINLNILTLTHLTKLFLPGMVKRGSGRILNISSTAAFQPGPLMSVYYATKAYVLLFSEGIANELKGTGVTVTALCPGPTESGFQDAAALGESKLVKGKRLPQPAAVAQFGIKAMLKGKPLAIHGVQNWILAQSMRLIPRRLAANLVRNAQERS